MGARNDWAERKKQRIDAKDTLISQLQSRIEKLRAILYWAEIDTGSTIKAGTEVRSVLKYYRAKKDHKKGVIVPALDPTNWEEIEETE